jgi:hypothetical protein
MGELIPPRLESIRDGEAAGILLGGTLTQLLASFGTPFAFAPPQGYVLFLDEVGERPYRLDRMVTQLRQSGLLARASAVVIGELPNCDEPGGEPTARAVMADLFADFPVRSSSVSVRPHGGPAMTLPFGVACRVVADRHPRVIVRNQPSVSQTIHLIGICGTAMATLAAMLKRKGSDVRGSDQDVYPPMSDFPRRRDSRAGRLSPGTHHRGPRSRRRRQCHLARQPELEEVLDRKIRYCSLPEAIREHFLWGARSIVVAGTHGKTTTTR